MQPAGSFSRYGMKGMIVQIRNIQDYTVRFMRQMRNPAKNFWMNGMVNQSRLLINMIRIISGLTLRLMSRTKRSLDFFCVILN